MVLKLTLIIIIQKRVNQNKVVIDKKKIWASWNGVFLVPLLDFWKKGIFKILYGKRGIVPPKEVLLSAKLIFFSLKIGTV